MFAFCYYLERHRICTNHNIWWSALRNRSFQMTSPIRFRIKDFATVASQQLLSNGINPKGLETLQYQKYSLWESCTGELSLDAIMIGMMIILYHDSSNRIVADHNILYYRPPDFRSRYWQESVNSCKTIFYEITGAFNGLFLL
jgi:5-formaminoimidazole-4-carboxamide-1-beta-D-ribofuranosyl 5'-monophosphate synthetase